jgi:exosortase
LDGSKTKRWGTGVVAALLILLYTPTFSALVKVWWGSDVYSHGFLIIPISLYLIFTKRADWATKVPVLNFIFGIFVLVFSMVMFLLGRLGNMITLEALSFITTIAGTVLLLLGRPFLSAWRFPIAYLLFMIPIDRLLLQKVHWPLQLFSAQMGTSLLNLFGFPAFLQDEYIELPNITLEVAKACSGLNYLTAIIAVGMPLAYLSLKNVKWQFALVLSAVIIAILANGIRVAFAGILGSLGHAIHGPWHIFEGVVIAWIGFIALFVGAWVFSRIESRGY